MLFHTSGHGCTGYLDGLTVSMLTCIIKTFIVIDWIGNVSRNLSHINISCFLAVKLLSHLCPFGFGLQCSVDDQLYMPFRQPASNCSCN